MQEYLNTSGRIFDIQRYSIHDGPGVRTIVFLKGCALRCRWCCNPESQSFEVETMTINGKPKVMGKDVTVAEVMKTVERDMPYYLQSGGGITLSGGECTLQPEFSLGLLRAAKDLGISTAIESMAYAKYEVIETLLPYLDTYLMDIKHMNPQKHKKFIGHTNELVLENAKRIKDSGANLTIRVPVIPTFNNTVEEISEIAKFAKSLGVEKLHLLPYHRMGEDKYAGLGREYLLKGTEPMTDDYMQKLYNAAHGIFGDGCQIGG